MKQPEPTFAARVSGRLRQHAPVLRHGAGQISFQITAMALPFLLLPVLTGYFPPDQYGYFNLYTLLLSVLIPAVLAGAENLLTYTYFKRTLAARRSLVSGSILLSLCLVIVLMGLSWLFLPELQTRLEFSPWVILSMAMIAGLGAVFTLGQAVAVMEHNLFLQGLFIMGRAGFAYAVSLLFLFGGMHHWHVMVIGQAFALGVLALVALVYLRRLGLLGRNIRVADMLDIPMTGGLMAVFSLTGIFLSLVERLVVQHLLGAHDMGLYSVPSLLMGGVMGLLLAMTRSISPHTIRLMSEAAQGREHKKVVYIYTASWTVVVLSFTAAAIVGAPVMRLLTAPAYHSATVLLVPMAVAMGCFTFFMWNSTLLLFEKKSMPLLAVTGAGALTDVVLANLLIPAHGLLGAAWASAGAFALMAALGFALMLYYVPLPWYAAWHDMYLTLLKEVKARL